MLQGATAAAFQKMRASRRRHFLKNPLNAVNWLRAKMRSSWRSF
jgi:hypothetical protein